MKNRDKVCLAALNKFGEENQMNMATEEVGEFLQALNKLRRFNDKMSAQYDQLEDELASEVADVIIMMNQIKFIVGRDRVESHIIQKLNRLKTKIADPKITK